MTKKNLESGIMGSFLEYKFLYSLAVLTRSMCYFYTQRIREKALKKKKSNVFKGHLVSSVYIPKLQAKN